jgi:hypothetical protein
VADLMTRFPGRMQPGNLNTSSRSSWSYLLPIATPAYTGVALRL